MQKFEKDYAFLIAKALNLGTLRETRNAKTKAIFGEMLRVSVRGGIFPLLQGRKMFSKGVFGELAAMLRRPTNVVDFEKWGCSYWRKWAEPSTGDLKLDYGNTWFDFNGVDQIAQLKDKLANNPTDRRMIISSWKPDGLEELSLPCCHHTYQFYVDLDTGELNMSWSQRSVDLMIGLPSDIVFAAAWLIAVAKEFNLRPGEITMFLGDCHVYEQHIEGAKEYLGNVYASGTMQPVYYCHTPNVGHDFCEFKPEDLTLDDYSHCPKIDLELIA